MPLKIKIKASLLLHALLMMLLFSYLLSFAIERIESEKKLLQNMRIEQEAYTMAHFIYDDFLKVRKCQSQEFNLGQGECQIKPSKLEVSIHHKSNRDFSFTFRLNSKKQKNLIR